MGAIVNQGYRNLEYIVVNDGSTDGTVEISRKYEGQVSCWFSQTNQGLYGAVNAGCARSTGEIMGWLNSSDLLQGIELCTVGSVFAGLREVAWICVRPARSGAMGVIWWRTLQ